MAEAAPRPNPDRAFVLLLTPLAAASLPSLLWCALEVVLTLSRTLTNGQFVVHVPPQTALDRLVVLETLVHRWIAHWNSLATLAATSVLVLTLLRPRWRAWAGLALIPYGVLLCADFTMGRSGAFLP